MQYLQSSITSYFNAVIEGLNEKIANKKLIKFLFLSKTKITPERNILGINNLICYLPIRYVHIITISFLFDL